MRRYRLVSGKHHVGSGQGRRVYCAGVEGKDIIETDEDIQSRFPYRFQEISVGNGLPLQAPTAVPTTVPTKKKAGKEKAPPQVTKERVDVTSKFTEAADAELLVFCEGKEYYVAEPESPDDNINEDGLRKQSVNKYIREYAEPED